MPTHDKTDPMPAVATPVPTPRIICCGKVVCLNKEGFDKWVSAYYKSSEFKKVRAFIKYAFKKVQDARNTFDKYPSHEDLVSETILRILRKAMTGGGLVVDISMEAYMEKVAIRCLTKEKENKKKKGMEFVQDLENAEDRIFASIVSKVRSFEPSEAKLLYQMLLKELEAKNERDAIIVKMLFQGYKDKEITAALDKRGMLKSKKVDDSRKQKENAFRQAKKRAMERCENILNRLNRVRRPNPDWPPGGGDDPSGGRGSLRNNYKINDKSQFNFIDIEYNLIEIPDLYKIIFDKMGISDNLFDLYYLNCIYSIKNGFPNDSYRLKGSGMGALDIAWMAGKSTGNYTCLPVAA